MKTMLHTKGLLAGLALLVACAPDLPPRTAKEGEICGGDRAPCESDSDCVATTVNGIEVAPPRCSSARGTYGECDLTPSARLDHPPCPDGWTCYGDGRSATDTGVCVKGCKTAKADCPADWTCVDSLCSKPTPPACG